MKRGRAKQRREKFSSPAVAHHEAGHAVAAQVLGVAVKYASIVPTDQYRGIVAYKGLFPTVKPGQEDSDRTRLRVERSIIIALAAEVAQHKYRPSSWRSYHGSSDYRAIVNPAAHFYEGKTLAAFLRWLELRAQELVEAHWSAIERVAQALLKRGTLSGDEIKEATWPPGTPRLRISKLADGRISITHDEN